MRTFPIIESRPYVLYSVASSIDGITASKTGDSSLSDYHDWEEVHTLRSSVDAIMVGINTILTDDSRLTVIEEKENALKSYPYRIVIDSSLRTPLTARVVQFKKDKYKTIIGSIESSEDEYITRKKQLENEGVMVIESGQNPQVDLPLLLVHLKSLGINSIMLEGGGTLAWSFLSNGLIDELRHFISPVLCGGKEATSIIMGEGCEKMGEAPKFSLKKIEQRQDYVTMIYQKR